MAFGSPPFSFFGTGHEEGPQRRRGVDRLYASDKVQNPVRTTGTDTGQTGKRNRWIASIHANPTLSDHDRTGSDTPHPTVPKGATLSACPTLALAGERFASASVKNCG